MLNNQSKNSNRPNSRVTSSHIRVLIADDHHVVRSALKSFLAKETDIEIVGEVADGNDLIPALEKHLPDVLVLDVNMPNHNVLRSARTIRKTYPTIRILALSAYQRREYVIGLFKAGAAGYVLKDDPANALIQGVRAVMQGQRWVSARVMDVLVESAQGTQPHPADALTNREIELLELIAKGWRNAQIAEQLHLTEQTVKNYIRKIFEKMQVETRVEAVVKGIQKGLIALPESAPQLD